MIEIGKTNRLAVMKITEAAALLDGKELGKILLPRRQAPAGCRAGDVLEAFVYNDSEDRVIATTRKPLAMVGDFAALKVLSVTPVGAFLDWGLPKDLLVPFGEQQHRMEAGKVYLVKVFLDRHSRRIAASSRLDRHFDPPPPGLREGQAVDLIIGRRTELGYKAIVERSCWGVLYQNEIFQPLKLGQQVSGFVKKIRDDNKIDLCLQRPGRKKIEDVPERILAELQKQGGYIPVTDTSPPEVIYERFGVSKKLYKKSIGMLYKKRRIRIEEAGIRLCPEEEGGGVSGRDSRGG